MEKANKADNMGKIESDESFDAADDEPFNPATKL
jgi:hypothetical protein